MLEDGWGPVLPEPSAPLPLGMLQCLGWTPGVLCVGSTRGVGSGEGRGLVVTQKGLTLSCWAQPTGYEARAAVEAQTQAGPSCDWLESNGCPAEREALAAVPMPTLRCSALWCGLQSGDYGQGGQLRSGRWRGTWSHYGQWDSKGT